jgi:hypothetical protein
MAVKKNKEDGQGGESADPFAYDLQKTAVDFNAETLLKNFREKNGESATRKYSIAERIKNAKKNIQRVQTMVANLELKQQSESGIFFLNTVVRPIADELRLAFSQGSVTVFGPSGLSGQSVISVGPKDVQPGKNRTASVTLVPTPEGGMAIRNYAESTDTWTVGSPEQLSGWNHPLVEVPKENPLEFICQWLASVK